MPRETYVGAIDQGTTGTRFLIFDRPGRVVADAYERHEQHYPHPGWVEHDPRELWENTKSVVSASLSSSGIRADQLAAIGITNQRETTVLWETATGEPIGNAIVWQDRRTTDRIEALEAEGSSDWIKARTGLEPDAYFSASKVEWMLENLEAPSRMLDRGSLRAAAEAGEVVMGTVDSWLIYNLTGNHVTDVTNASRTMLFDIHSMDWDDDLLAEFSVPPAMLPEVRPSIDATPYGTTDPDGFLGAEIPIGAALGDQQAALFGQACFDVGDAKNTYGTGSFFLMNTGEEPISSDHGLLTTVGFQRAGEPAHYAIEGSIFVTGAAIEWLVDVDLIDTAGESATLAQSVDSTEGVYMVPAFTGLGAPQWDGRARGTLIGLTLSTRKEHIVRATLESIAFQTRAVMEAIEEDADTRIDPLRVDGGAVKNDFLCQLQADLTQTTIIRPEVDETTALGAAYAAGLAVGYWESMDELRGNWSIGRRFDPSIDGAASDDRYARWIEAVERSKDWAVEDADDRARW